MVGKIYTSITPFYDLKQQKNAFKSRPVLVIAETRNNDYTVLPISTISKKENRDPVYDVEISPSSYPKLNLAKVSYVRTHKQMPMHRTNIGKEIGDLKAEYENLYVEILSRKEQWNKMIDENAI